MAARVGAVRALAGLLLGLGVLAAVVLLARPTAPGAAPPAPGTVADQARAPSATAGELPPATSTPAAANAAGTTSPPAADPCRLVTRAEAAAALAQPVARVQLRQGFLVRSCLFTDAGGRQLVVQLHYGPAASREQFRMGRRPADQPAAGVGDEAWFTPDTGLLDVREGTARFQIGLLDATGRPASRRAPPGLLTLAKAIAGRLR
jgi:hypothetical protein